jgi:hypothetical protein
VLPPIEQGEEETVNGEGAYEAQEKQEEVQRDFLEENAGSVRNLF